MSALLWLGVAVAIDRAQFRITGTTYGTRYSGEGCIDDVLARRADSPMAYRVLVPWLIALAERMAPRVKPLRRRLLYEPLKVLLLALALWTAERAIGLTGALLVAALLPMTFLFDYWDWEVELGALAAGLTGDLRLALAWAVPAGLSRETAPLAAVTYGLVTHDLAGSVAVLGVTLAAMIGARRWAGEHPFYCERLTWRRNRGALVAWYRQPSMVHNISMSLLLGGATLWAVGSGRAGAAWPVPLAILALGWTLALINETRVFTGCLLWVALAATR